MEERWLLFGLFYGTQTGNTQTEAELIQKEFGGDSVVDIYDISKVESSDFDGYKYKLWGQFNRNGEIITADFWVKAT